MRPGPRARDIVAGLGIHGLPTIQMPGAKRAQRTLSVFFRQQNGTLPIPADCRLGIERCIGRKNMNGLIYLVGLVVVILAVLSFFGLR